MLRLPKKENKKNRLTRFTSRKVLYGLVVAVVFGAVGSYLVGFSHADQSSPVPGDYAAQRRLNESPHIVIDYPQPIGPAAVGVGLNIPLQMDYSFYNPGESSMSHWHALLQLTSGYSKLQYLGYTCKVEGACKASSANEFDSFRHRKDAMICIEIPFGMNGGSLQDIVTVHYKALVDIPVHNTYYQDLGLIIYHDAVVPGTCESNPGGSDAYWSAGIHTCGYSYRDGKPIAPADPPCDRGPDIGVGPPSNTSTSTTTNTGTNTKTGSGSGGGGGGGSTAKTQSSNPNTIPSSAAQGEQTKQPKVDPSPFFDGKLFAAGSNAFDNANTVSIGGFKLGYGWFYLAGALALAGIGGFFGWKWWQGSKKK